MTITNFARLITKEEGLKKQVNIAQVAEVLRVANKLAGGLVYKVIKGL